MKNFKQSFQREMNQYKMSEQAKERMIQKGKKERRKVIYKPLLLTACMMVVFAGILLMIFQQQTTRVGQAEDGIQSIRIDTEARYEEDGTTLTNQWFSSERELSSSKFEAFQKKLNASPVIKKEIEPPSLYYVVEVTKENNEVETFLLFSNDEDTQYYVKELDTDKIYKWVDSVEETELFFKLKPSVMEIALIAFILCIPTLFSTLFIEKEKKEPYEYQNKVKNIFGKIAFVTTMLFAFYVIWKTRNIFYGLLIITFASIIGSFNKNHIRMSRPNAMKLLEGTKDILSYTYAFTIFIFILYRNQNALYVGIAFIVLSFILWLVMKNREEVTCPHCDEVLDYRTTWKLQWGMKKYQACGHCAQPIYLNKRRIDLQGFLLSLVLGALSIGANLYGIHIAYIIGVIIVYVLYFILFSPLFIRVDKEDKPLW